MKRQRTQQSQSEDTVVIGTASEDALYAELRDSIGEQPSVIPAGRLTVEQWAAKWNRSRAHAGRLLNHGVKIGTWGMVKYRIPTPSRGLYQTPHYFRKTQ